LLSALVICCSASVFLIDFSCFCLSVRPSLSRFLSVVLFSLSLFLSSSGDLSETTFFSFGLWWSNLKQDLHNLISAMFFFSSSALLFSFPPRRLIGVVVEKRLKQLKCFACCVCVSCELMFGFLCMASFQIIVVRFFMWRLRTAAPGFVLYPNLSGLVSFSWFVFGDDGNRERGDCQISARVFVIL
jgi:hypothetical protein